MTALFDRRFALAWVANLFQGMAFFLFVHLPRFLEDLGATESVIGLLFAVTAAAAILVRPAVGSMMDQRGRMPVVLAGGLLNLAVISLYLTVDRVGVWIFVIRALHGISEAMLFTALFTLGADSVPDKRRTQGLALFGVSGLLPIALAGLLGDVILEWSGFDALFLTALGFAVAGVAIALPIRDSDEVKAARRRVPFSGPLLQTNLLPVWWFAFVFSVALSAYFTFIRTFLDAVGFATVGLFFGVYASTAIALRLFAGALPERIGPKRVLYAAMAVFSAGLATLGLANSASWIAVAGVLCGVGHGYGYPIMFAIAVDRARPGERGTSVAIFTGIFDVGWLVAGPLFGLVIEGAGYPTMFGVAAVWVVIGMSTFAWWDGDLPRRSVAASPV